MNEAANQVLAKARGAYDPATFRRYVDTIEPVLNRLPLETLRRIQKGATIIADDRRMRGQHLLALEVKRLRKAAKSAILRKGIG